MSSSSAPTVPALRNGDRLTRDEFERRYEAMPHVKKAELIDGTVYMPSPVRFNSHGRPHSALIGWLFTYAAATPGVSVGDNSTVRLDLDNEPQPDGLLRIVEEAGGQSRISDDDYVEGPPELVAEVAHSSVAYDLHDKKRAYRRHGVQEYLVWRVEEAQVDWFVLEGGAYLPLSPDENGRVASRMFPGLLLDVEALLSEDFDTLLAAQQEQIGSEAHQAFVERLAAESGGN